MLTFVEDEKFARTADRLLTEGERFELMTRLATSPEAGDLIPGSGGCRKLRFRAKGKGSRGGASLKEIIRRKTALLSGAARPGRVTQLLPDGKGGFVRRSIEPEAIRKAQADRHAAGVAAAREKLGLSQREMAALIGVSPRTLQNWEQGQREPSQAAKMLLRVAIRHPRAVLDAIDRKFAA